MQRGRSAPPPRQGLHGAALPEGGVRERGRREGIRLQPMTSRTADVPVHEIRRSLQESSASMMQLNRTSTRTSLSKTGSVFLLLWLGTACGSSEGAGPAKVADDGGPSGSLTASDSASEA